MRCTPRTCGPCYRQCHAFLTAVRLTPWQDGMVTTSTQKVSRAHWMRSTTWLQTRSMWKIWQVSLRSRVRNRVRHQVPEPLVVGSAMCWSCRGHGVPRRYGELRGMRAGQVRSAVCDERAGPRHADAKQVVDAEAQTVCPVFPRCGRRGTVLRVPRLAKHGVGLDRW